MTMVRREVDKQPVRTWEIWNGDLGEKRGSVQGGVRPVLVVQNDTGNKYCPTVNVIPMTSSKTKKLLPMHIVLKAEDTGLYSDSTIMPEQIQTIEKNKLEFKIADVPTYMIESIKGAIKLQLSCLN